MSKQQAHTYQPGDRVRTTVWGGRPDGQYSGLVGTVHHVDDQGGVWVDLDNDPFPRFGIALPCLPEELERFA